MRLSKALLLLLGIFLAFPFFSEETIDEKLKRLASDVAEIAQKESGVKDKLALLKKRVLLSETTLTKLKKEKESALIELETFKKEMEKVKEEENEVFAYFKSRLKIMYIAGFMGEYRALFSTESAEDLLQANLLLNSLAMKDEKEIQRLNILRRDKESKESALKERMATIEAVERESILERERLSEEIKNVNKILESLSQNGEIARKNLAETIENAKKMDLYFKDLNFKNKVEMYGKNILLFKGRLLKPVKGKVIQGFGDYLHPKFKTKLPHTGIDFEAAYGSEISAIFDGEVVFADWLSGYGYTVIISHSQGYYSLYSHLDKIETKIGDVIKTGQRIGLSGGDPTKNFSGIYFELRQGKTAVDPLPWFKE
ncbi:MAG: murein hydrolase activator EnvC [Acidobacteriota bacterium]